MKEIVTYDGTEFKQGMISGGNHGSVFNVNLGTSQLDSSISELVDKIQRLEREHARLKQELEEDVTDKEARTVKQVTNIELELESLREKKQAVTRQILVLAENNEEIEKNL